MMVQDILTSVAIRLKRSATLQEAAILMRDRHVGAVLVTEEGSGDRPVGIVTDRDIAIHAAAEGRSPTACAIEDVMTPAVVTVPHKARVGEALDQFDAQFRHVAKTQDRIARPVHAGDTLRVEGGALVQRARQRLQQVAFDLLRTASGLIIRPQSCAQASCTTRIAPFARSTSTCIATAT